MSEPPGLSHPPPIPQYARCIPDSPLLLSQGVLLVVKNYLLALALRQVFTDGDTGDIAVNKADNPFPPGAHVERERGLGPSGGSVTA